MTENIDLASGCQLVGGELVEWSDLAGHRPGGVMEHLVSLVVQQRAPRSVCLLGPTAGAALDLVPAEIPLTVVTRGLPDAREFASRGSIRSGFTVICGDLGRVHDIERADLVVALDPVHVLLGPDSRGQTHLESLQTLLNMVADGGVLVAAQENEFDATRLARGEPEEQGDGEWFRGSEGYDNRRLYLSEFQAWLGRTGRVARLYGAWPTPEVAALLVGADATTEVTALARFLASREVADYFSDRPALMDPQQFIERVFDSGLYLDLAPAWVAVLSESELQLPTILATEPHLDPAWQLNLRVDHIDGAWRQTERSGSGRAETGERRVTRDFRAGSPGVAEGQLLESALRSACASVSLRAARNLVTAYADWIRDAARWPGGLAFSKAFAAPQNVHVSPSGAMAVVDPTWGWHGEIDDDAAIASGLWAFARRLLKSGVDHQWRPDISPDALTESLCVMAGVEWTDALALRLARLNAEITATITSMEPAAEGELVFRHLEVGVAPGSAAPGSSRGYKETLARAGRLGQALFERSEQVEWLEATLRSRDRRLGELEKTLEDVRKSVSFRTGRAITSPGRTIARVVKRGIK